MNVKHLSQNIGAGIAACILAVAGVVPTAAHACTDPGATYLGTVCMTAANFCPRGYSPLDGQMLTIPSNSALFALLGCAWGGDCRTSFRLPDMRGRMPMGEGLGPGLTDRTLGQFAGAETHTLAVSELAAHNHASAFTPAGAASIEFNAYDGLGSSVTPDATNKFLQTVGASPFSASTDTLIYGDGTGTEVPLGGVDFTGTGGTVTIGDTGEGRPFSILNPMTVLTFCIATEGLFPPRE